MSKYSPSKWELFLEASALDWLPIVFNESKLPADSERKAEVQQAQQQINSLDAEDLKQIINYLESLLEDEEKRRVQTEAKASSLIGFTAIASSFIIGFAQFLFTSTTIIPLFRIIITALYIFIAFSLLITIILATRVVRITGLQRPRAFDILDIRDFNRNTIYRQRAVSLVSAYRYNQVIGNKKLTYVRGAQDWFRNVVYLLILLLGSLAVMIIFNPYLMIQQAERPVQVIILTPVQSIVTPTPTSTVSAVPTAISTTVIPTTTATTIQVTSIPTSITVTVTSSP